MKESDNVRVPVQARSRQTREQIVTAGRELFARKGYQHAGVKEIARAAGVAVGSFYAYFPDKQALFLEITEEYYRQIFARIQSEPFASPSQSRDGQQAVIGTMIHALYDAHDIEPELHRELQLMILAGGTRADGDGEDDRDNTMHRVVRERVDAMDREVQAWLTEIIRRYAPSRDPETAAAVVFRSAEETIHRLKFFPETMPPAEKVIGELSRMLSAYLFQE
jgi:AcrR family transcriptional regulator